MLCWSCGMHFATAASSENDQGSMNLASKTASVASTRPSRVAPIHLRIGCRTRRGPRMMADPELDVDDGGTGICLVPVSVQFLSGSAELHDKVTRQVLRFDLPTFFPPK